MSLKSSAKKIKATLLHRSNDSLTRQQLICYLVGEAMIVIGISCHLLGAIGVDMKPLRLLSITALLFSLIIFMLWALCQISLKTAFIETVIFLQAVQSVRIIYIINALPKDYTFLIILNGVISMILMVMAGISYFRLTTHVVGIANIITLIVAACCINDLPLRQFVVIVIFFSVLFLFLSDLMCRNVKDMRKKNRTYKADEQRLLEVLRLNRNEISTYVEMCRTEERSDTETDRLFSMLSEKSQHNIVNAVNRKKAFDMSREKDIQDKHPDFTPMEVEVARLVLANMKLKQIIALTGKSESNISVVRSRIRKKMGLTPDENLHDALQKEFGNMEDNG